MLRSPLMITFEVSLAVVEDIAEADPALAVKSPQQQLLERQVVLSTAGDRHAGQQQRERYLRQRSGLTHDVVAAEIVLAGDQLLRQQRGIMIAGRVVRI